MTRPSKEMLVVPTNRRLSLHLALALPDIPLRHQDIQLWRRWMTFAMVALASTGVAVLIVNILRKTL